VGGVVTSSHNWRAQLLDVSAAASFKHSRAASVAAVELDCLVSLVVSAIPANDSLPRTSNWRLVLFGICAMVHLRFNRGYTSFVAADSLFFGTNSAAVW